MAGSHSVLEVEIRVLVPVEMMENSKLYTPARRELNEDTRAILRALGRRGQCKPRSEGDCTHRRSSLPPFPADSQSRSPPLSLTPTRFRWPKRLSLTVAALTSIPCSPPLTSTSPLTAVPHYPLLVPLLLTSTSYYRFLQASIIVASYDSYLLTANPHN
ncbi:hypothetical protein Pcinc_041811 [Petrolisthes cinctipes]|uniref:Uncharacterized protein n=1 Tax=Petrolisthes cinctipes TaxID=88211 RepID=A0AAE1BIR3_PETCI|nr:hypothetical protein Pcinc_041811 [Petrolisthes cinctipes]